MYTKTMKTLIEGFKKFPGIGEKTAERLALSTLNMDESNLLDFSNALASVQTKIKRCKKCNNLTEDEFCFICNDEQRDLKTICVVEDPKNIVIFEKIGKYNGLYHVLDGLISPLAGINPEDINLEVLLNRIEKEKIKELILALKPSIEGETTALYISKLLENTDVSVTKIAHGIPLGADMDYIDPLTLELALVDRKKIS